MVKRTSHLLASGLLLVLLFHGAERPALAQTGQSSAEWADSFIVALADNGALYYAGSNGDGLFHDYAEMARLAGSGCRGVTMDDFDGDGDLDVVAGWSVSGTVHFDLFLNDGNDTFTAMGEVGTLSNLSSFAMDMAAGDFDEDGNTDFIANGNSAYTGLFLGNGLGAFVRTEMDLGGWGRGMDVADFDGDGHLDFARAMYSSGHIHVHPGNGDGTFQAPVFVGDTGNDPYGLAAADFDNDGHVDLIASAGSNGDSYFFKGFGDGSFTNRGYIASLDPNRHVGYDGYDLNSDGHVDMVVVDYSSRKVWFYPGLGDGSFGTRVQVGSTSANVLAVAAPPFPILGAPQARAEPPEQTIAPGGIATFDGSHSTDSDGTGTIISWDWDFGDGNSDSGEAVSHQYGGDEASDEGIYTVVLTVTDDDGLTDRDMVTVNVLGNPPAANAGGPYSVGEEMAAAGSFSVNFDGSDSSDAGGILRYAWDFGDTGTGTGVAPLHIYEPPLLPADYTVVLTVYDHAEQSHSDTTTVTVAASDPPVADAGGPYEIDESSAREGRWQVDFDAGHSSDDFGIYRYEWDFDDSDGIQVDATTVNPTHFYDHTGTRTVTLRVYDHALQVAETTTQVTVSAGDPPVASTGGPYLAGESSAREGQWQVDFDAGHSSDDFSIYRYEWDFDDSDGIQVDATAVDPTHFYDHAGTRTVTLRVYDHALQVTEVTTEATTRAGDPPVADAGGPYEGEAFAHVHFNADGSGDDTGIARYLWDFGDGHAGEGASPPHVYTEEGSYTATLTVFDNLLQSDSDQATVTITPGTRPLASLIVNVADDGVLYRARCYGDGLFHDYAEMAHLGGSGCRGVTMDDFDGDGDLDVVAGWSVSGTVHFDLFLNDGNDTFTAMGEVGTLSNLSSFAMDMAAGDFDEDGNTDFIANGHSAYTGLFLGDGLGAFVRTEMDLGGWGRGMDVADFDGDGHLDFARAMYSSGHIHVHPGNGDGTFQAPVFVGDTGNDPYGLAAADFDNDGNVDLIANAGSSGDAYFFKGFGDGSFTNRGYIASLDANNHVSYDGYDLNSDGHVDMVVVDYSSRKVWFYPGLGDGSFGPRVLVGSTSANVLGVSAPPYRMDAMLYWYWLREHELAGSDALRLADPDEDGLPNAYEYAFQMDPTVLDVASLAPYDPGNPGWTQFHGLPLWTVTGDGRLVVEYVHFLRDPTLGVSATFNHELVGGSWTLPASPPMLMESADGMGRFRVEHAGGEEDTCFGSVGVLWYRAPVLANPDSSPYGQQP